MHEKRFELHFTISIEPDRLSYDDNPWDAARVSSEVRSWLEDLGFTFDAFAIRELSPDEPTIIKVTR